MISKTVGPVVIEVDNESSPMWVDVEICSINGIYSRSRVNVETLRDLQYACERVFAQLEWLK